MKTVTTVRFFFDRGVEERRICGPRASYHLFVPLADACAAAVNYRNWQIRHFSTPSIINAGRGKLQR